MEVLADIIISANIETVEAIQHRYGEQVDGIFDIENIPLFLFRRYLIVYHQLLSKSV